jgi:hypothetical protein
MSCICCELEKLNLGCVTVCDTLKINYTAPIDDTYTLKVIFGQQVIEIQSDILAGNTLTFDISDLNESYIFTGVVSNSTGDLIFIDAGLIQYDCVQFQTVVGQLSNPQSIAVTV